MKLMKTATLVLAISATANVFASDLSLNEQDYVSQSSVELLQQQEQSSGWSVGGQGMAQDLPADLEQEEFEDVMKTNFYGSYVFYKRLGTEQKEQVYDVYLGTDSIDSVRDETVRLLSMR